MRSTLFDWSSVWMAVQFRSLPLRAAKPLGLTAPRPAPRAQPVTPRASSALGEVLLERDLITREQLDAAIEHQRTSSRRLGQVLIDLGFTTPDAVLGALSIQLGVPATRLHGAKISAAAVQALPERIARKHLAVPIQKVGMMLQVAIACPTDLAALDDLRFASGCQIQTCVALEDEIVAALDRFYSEASLESAEDDQDESVRIETPSSIERREASANERRQGRGRRKSDQTVDVEQFDEATEETAVRAVDRILNKAGNVGASDIHLERTAENLRVRLRVDGTFVDIGYVSASVAPAICARLKVLAGMDIAEHRVPQDGRMSVTIGTRRLDFRASTYPTIHGEKVVLRVLDQGALRLELGALGVRSPLLEDFREVIRRPEGLILITGPTGSGKT